MSPEPLAFEVTLAVVSLVSKLMQSRQFEKSTIRSFQSAHVEIAAGISIAIITVVGRLGDKLGTTFTSVQNALK
jgi:hypothetical protein